MPEVSPILLYDIFEDYMLTRVILGFRLICSQFLIQGRQQFEKIKISYSYSYYNKIKVLDIFLCLWKELKHEHE